MNTPLWLRPSAESWTGSLLVELHECDHYRPKSNATLKEKVSRAAYRSLDALKIAFACLIDSLRHMIATCFCIPQARVNLIATLATSILLLGIPFGHIPKVHFLRHPDQSDCSILRRPNPRAADRWWYQLEQNKTVLNLLQRIDEFSSIQQLEEEVNKSDPQVMQLLNTAQASFSGAILHIAARHKLHSLVRRLFQIGVPVDTLMLEFTTLAGTPKQFCLIHYATREIDSKLVALLVSKGSNPNPVGTLMPLDELFLAGRTKFYLQCDSKSFEKSLKRDIMNIASQLIRAGAKLNRDQYVEFFNNVADWNVLDDNQINVRITQNRASLNAVTKNFSTFDIDSMFGSNNQSPFARNNVPLNETSKQSSARRIQKFAQILQHDIFPKLEKIASEVNARQTVVN